MILEAPGLRHKGVDCGAGGLHNALCARVVVGSSHRIVWARKNAAGTELGNFVCCIVGYALFLRSNSSREWSHGTSGYFSVVHFLP